MRHELIIEQPVIATDEITLNLVKEDKVKCFMWLYFIGDNWLDNKLIDTDVHNIVLYNYRISRAGKRVVDDLLGYSGWLQVDECVDYEKSKAILVGCWIHTRRKPTKARPHKAKN